MCDKQDQISEVLRGEAKTAAQAGMWLGISRKSEASIAREKADVDHFLAHIAAEVGAAKAKFPSPEALLAALSEEYGEVAKAVLSESWANVRKEAIQCAAMCVRLALEGDPTLDHYRQKNGLEVFRG